MLTLKEIERLINGTQELRHQTFILCSFSMGLRLGEALSLTVGDIDSERMKAHPKTVYAVLMRSATFTLKRFGLNKKALQDNGTPSTKVT